ncbi:MAG: transcriptional repressor [Dehalococcoidia bacterium]|nr:transcriptional repressor [Dehalococcoidia bacterium]
MSRKELSSAGERITGQRLLLLDLIKEGSGHLGADELHRLARERMPRLSLSTVYRTLQLFKKLGLVRECHFDETHLHYETNADDDHHHIICRCCGDVVEFRCPESRLLRRRVSSTTGFSVTRMAVQMEGLCAACREKANQA